MDKVPLESVCIKHLSLGAALRHDKYAYWNSF